MADDLKAERIPAFPGASEFPGGTSLPRRRAYRAYANSAAHDHASADVDVASILGVPAESLSQESLRILQRILGDAEDLRRQLDAAERHRRHLEDQADLYPGLQCLNGHAFVRELDAFMVEDSERHGEDWGWLWVIHADGIDHAAGRNGLAFGGKILRDIFEALRRTAQTGEPLAYLGFGTFGWVMIGQDAAGAQSRLNGFLAAAKMSVTGVPLDFTTGMAPLIAGKTATQAVEEAEIRRMQLTGPVSSDSVQP